MVHRELLPTQSRLGGIKKRTPSPFRSTGRPILLALAVLSYTVSPVVSWIATSMVLAGLGKRSLTLAWNFLAFLPMAVTINSSKGIINDWGWYTRHFLEEYPSYALLDIFGNLSPSNQWEEPLYYAGSWIFAQLFPGDIGMLIVMIVTFVYGSLSLATVLISRGLKLDATSAVMLQFLLFGYGMTFTLVTHLVRQSMAAAVLILALAFIIQKKPGAALIAVVTATLIHTSAVVLGSFIVLAGFLPAFKHARALLVFPLIGVATGFTFWFLYGYRYAGVDKGSVSLLVVLVDLAILCALVIQSYSSSREVRPAHYLVATVMLLHLGFVLGTILEPTPVLRFYLYLAAVSAVGGFLVIRELAEKFLDRSSRLWLLGLVGVGAVLSMDLRIARSQFGIESTFAQFIWLG